MLRECDYSFLLLHELTYQRRNILRCRIQREMTTIDNVDFGTGHISAGQFRLRGAKRCLVPAPKYQQDRLLLTQPTWPHLLTLHGVAAARERVLPKFGLRGLRE